MTFQLTTYRGDTPSWPMAFLVQAAGSRAPLSLEGVAILFSVKDDPAMPDSEARIAKVILPVAHVDAAGGKTTLNLTGAETMLPVGRYYCDFKSIDGGGHVKTLAVGTFEVRQPVTHAVTAE